MPYNTYIIDLYRKRDAAHIKLKKMFYDAIDKRKQSNENGEKPDDMLQTLLDSKYKLVYHLYVYEGVWVWWLRVDFVYDLFIYLSIFSIIY